mgnify:CR=1 FL=1
MAQEARASSASSNSRMKSMDLIGCGGGSVEALSSCKQRICGCALIGLLYHRWPKIQIGGALTCKTGSACTLPVGNVFSACTDCVCNAAAFV